MLAIKPYRRAHAVEYARRWALSRNALFTAFDALGGDCTNFVSQCLFAGCCVMNGTPTFGWYYRAPGDYAPAWTGVVYLHQFLTTNMDVGPVGIEIPPESAEMGDVIQLARADGTYYHSLLVSGMRDGIPLVCAHDNDALDRPLDSYTYDTARAIHITGVRVRIPGGACCYQGMLSGTSIFPDADSAAMLSCTGVGADPADDEPSDPEASDEEVVQTQDVPRDELPPDFALPQRTETDELRAAPGS
ncbi:MAG: amidase domain-containing protein [Clostridia bacterium]|nr:amidase domain-containing protein [Clostridia bacterium]